MNYRTFYKHDIYSLFSFQFYIKVSHLRTKQKPDNHNLAFQQPLYSNMRLSRYFINVSHEKLLPLSTTVSNSRNSTPTFKMVHDVLKQFKAV